MFCDSPAFVSYWFILLITMILGTRPFPPMFERPPVLFIHVLSLGPLYTMWTAKSEFAIAIAMRLVSLIR